MTTTTRYYAAIQADTGTVYGVGVSEQLALEDARQWVDDLLPLAVVPCSEAAARTVIEHGGQPSGRLSVSRAGVGLRSEE